MSQRIEVPLARAQSGESVAADLWVGVDEAFAARADDTWSTFLAAWRADLAARELPIMALEHEHWAWREKVRLTKSALAYLTIGIECDGQVQGMIMLVTDGHFGRHAMQKNLPLVYVEYVATAPWNLRIPHMIPTFSGVGYVLMHAAVQVSRDLEFKGRLGLHSLPGAESFYDQLGMLCLTRDSRKQNLKYYEMTADGAESFAR